MTMNEACLNVEYTLHLGEGRRQAKRICPGEMPAVKTCEPGRIPRITRLMALAIRFEQLVRSGEVSDYADLARLGHVSRPRITQIMNLLNLAPDIQEAILFLPRVHSGDDPITEHRVRGIAGEMGWREQRERWGKIN